MSYTPGPWRVISEEWKSLSIHGIDDRFIADVSLHYDTAESNARLIAAAPDLLAALENLLCEPMAERTVDAAKRAINKAKGGL